MTHRSTRSIALPWLAAAVVVLVHGAAQVITGPTPIIDGEASAGDITVSNENLAFALAVESSAPYGVPRGAIVDVAPVVDGKPGRDRVVFADFIPNNWSAWSSTYQKVDVAGARSGSGRRDGRGATGARSRSRRRIRCDADADRVEIRTTMTNTGDARLTELLSGQTLWPSAGYFFGVPGTADLKEGTATDALTDRVVAYDEDWVIALHAPYLDYIGSGSADLSCRSTRSSLAPRAHSTRGCRSARAAISVPGSPPRSSASDSQPAPCRASSGLATVSPSTSR